MGSPLGGVAVSNLIAGSLIQYALDTFLLDILKGVRCVSGRGQRCPVSTGPGLVVRASSRCSSGRAPGLELRAGIVWRQGAPGARRRTGQDLACVLRLWADARHGDAHLCMRGSSSIRLCTRADCVWMPLSTRKSSASRVLSIRPSGWSMQLNWQSSLGRLLACRKAPRREGQRHAATGKHFWFASPSGRPG